MPTAAAAVHEGEKESLVYCGSATAAASVHKVPHTHTSEKGEREREL